MSGELVAGEVFAGRFRIERLLGRGGMGQVYLVEHAVLGRLLALKVLADDALDDPAALKLFRREARAASRIHHPNVTYIFDFGHDDEARAYLAMEYVPGRSLEQLLKQEVALGPTSLVRVADRLRQIAQGLAAAHEQGVAHLDLKPANVVVMDSAGEETLKLLDFGLARSFAKDGTAQSIGSTIRGTPYYMSPEQFSGASRLDARSDVYSFGVLTYELVAGHPPFAGTLPQVAMAHMKEEPPRLGAARNGVPAALEELVIACMQKKPADRPADGRELVARLRGLDAELDKQSLGQRGTLTALAATLPLLAPMLAPSRPTLGSAGPAAQLDSLRSAALDDLLALMRDRDLVDEPLEQLYAAKVEAEDALIELENEVTLTLARREALAVAQRRREGRLRLALVGTERTLQRQRSDVLQATRAQLANRMTALRDEHERISTGLREHLDGVGQSLTGALIEVVALHEDLVAQLRPRRTQLPLGEPEVLALLARAGI